MSIRVALIDDHQLIRTGVKMLLTRCDDIEVVAEADTLRLGSEAIQQTKPDVALLDLNLPDGSGLELMQVIAADSPRTKALVLSAHREEAWVQKAIAAGCAGYIDKMAFSSEVISAIRSVHAGRRVISISGMENLLLQDPAHVATHPPANADQQEIQTLSESLSKRECEVLARIARGKTNQQTADELFLSVKTIETYRSRLTRKLGRRGRSELFEFAQSAGLLSTKIEDSFAS